MDKMNDHVGVIPGYSNLCRRPISKVSKIQLDMKWLNNYLPGIIYQVKYRTNNSSVNNLSRYLLSNYPVIDYISDVSYYARLLF